MVSKKNVIVIGVVIIIVVLSSTIFIAVSGVWQGRATFNNLSVMITTDKSTYSQGENISGNFTLTNGRNGTIYLTGYPSYRVDILSKSNSKPVCPSKDVAAILVLTYIPISGHSTYSIYHPCILYNADEQGLIPPGEYIIRVQFKISLDFSGDSKNIVEYSGTTETPLVIV